MRSWFEADLNSLLTKLRTMPADAPGTLSDESYLDIMAHLLELNGFPPGASELEAEPALLTGIVVVDKGTQSIPNFSLVQVVGCLTRGADKAWAVTSGTEPLRTKDPGDSPAVDPANGEAMALGSQSYRLLELSLLGRQTPEGHKVRVKGFLIRQPTGDQLNVTSLQSVSSSCK
jgi:hypothetical protein